MNTEHFSMGGCVRALRRAHTLLANNSLFNNEMRFFFFTLFTHLKFAYTRLSIRNITPKWFA